MNPEYAVVKNNGFIYYGSFYKANIEVRKNQRWRVVHNGQRFVVISKKFVTLEIASEDFDRFFEMVKGEEKDV